MFKRIISFILTLALSFSAINALFAVKTSAEDVTGTDIPLIYLGGQGQIISVNENGNLRNIYPVSIPDGFIESAVSENIGVFMKAVITQEWEDFGSVVHDLLYQLYHELALDEYGNPINNSFCLRSRTENSDIDGSKVNGKFPTSKFTFYYDWRLDPYKIAQQLHSYIQRVMKITGYDRVALSGRCLGACIISAYMDKYDGEYVSDMILYCSALNGSTIISKMYAGDAYLDPDGIERFVYDLNLSADEITNQLIQSFVSVANETYGLDLLCSAFNNVIEDIYLDIFPQVLIDTMGTWPGFWSMVSDADYQRAKDTVFHNADMTKYAPFIKIIDDYHYNVQVKAPENFKKYIQRGIEIANITKFGYQTIPATHDADMISDALCSVSDASMGATTATLKTTLSDSYLSSARQNGNDRYISPDKKIDASTCLLPDRTWFIGNLQHKNFPEIIDRVIDEIINTDNLTVETSRFPQFMQYIDGALIPMTSENMTVTQEKYTHSFWDSLKTFFSSLFKILFKSFDKKET